MPKELNDLIVESKEILNRLWNEIEDLASKGTLPDAITDEKLKSAIQRAVNSNTKTYRYVLPTQILAKVADSSLDSRCLQVIRGGKGAFDARSICHSVIVQFDKQNDFVLGGSPEPYVNNPLRQPEVSPQYRNKQKDKSGWDDLCEVLKSIEDQNDKLFTELALKQTLIEIYKRLTNVRVTYPVPKRISLNQCITLITMFLSEQSGGDRVQAIVSALFLAVGNSFSLYSDVRRANINAADASSGQVADLECVSESGNIILAVEVKDRDLTINQIKDKLPNMRAQKVTEILFIAQQGIAKSDEDEVSALIEKEFVSGQNIYVFDLMGLAKSLLALLGENGRRLFLDIIGRELDRYRSDITHRRAWANLLSSF